jgi:hypothetical protein
MKSLSDLPEDYEPSLKYGLALSLGYSIPDFDRRLALGALEFFFCFADKLQVPTLKAALRT